MAGGNIINILPAGTDDWKEEAELPGTEELENIEDWYDLDEYDDDSL